MLRRGVYVSDGAQAWRHVRQSPSAHLTWSKGSPRTGRLRRLGKMLLLGARPVINLRGTGVFTIAVASHDDDLVLLDPVAGQVARTNHDRPVTDERAHLRERFARHVPVPSWTMRDEGRLIVEEYVDGRPLPSLPPATRRAVIEDLFDRAVDLVAAEGEVRPDGVLAALPDVLQAEGLPPTLRTGLGRLLANTDATKWPSVPCVDDAVIANLMVCDDGHAVLVDVRMSWRPFLYLPFGLVASEAADVAAAFLAGAFDDRVVALFGAAGLDPPSLDDHRDHLLWLPPVIDAHRQATRSGGLNPAWFAREVRRRWGRIAALTGSR